MNVLARPKKQGIDYFPLDVNFSEDEKIEMIEAEFGPTGFYVVLKLFMRIYGMDGYYMMFTEREQKLFSKRINVDINSVIAIINSALNEGIFDATLYKKYNILTSKGIQNRYFEIIQRRKDTEVIKEYLLIDIHNNENFKITSLNNENDNSQNDNNEVNVDINSINVDNNEVNVDTMSAINTQSKVKESKVNIFTKLNYIFNLIINNNSAELKIAEAEFKYLQDLFIRLDIYIPSSSLEKGIIPDDVLFKHKVLYYVIYSLYCSSYKVYLADLNREDLFNKLLKTEEYRLPLKEIEKRESTEPEQLEEFINYLIKSLQNHLQKEMRKTNTN